MTKQIYPLSPCKTVPLSTSCNTKNTFSRILRENLTGLNYGRIRLSHKLTDGFHKKSREVKNNVPASSYWNIRDWISLTFPSLPPVFPPGCQVNSLDTYILGCCLQSLTSQLVPAVVLCPDVWEWGWLFDLWSGGSFRTAAVAWAVGVSPSASSLLAQP